MAATTGRPFDPLTNNDRHTDWPDSTRSQITCLIRAVCRNLRLIADSSFRPAIARSGFVEPQSRWLETGGRDDLLAQRNAEGQKEQRIHNPAFAGRHRTVLLASKIAQNADFRRLPISVSRLKVLMKIRRIIDWEGGMSFSDYTAASGSAFAGRWNEANLRTLRRSPLQDRRFARPTWPTVGYGDLHGLWTGCTPAHPERCGTGSLLHLPISPTVPRRSRAVAAPCDAGVEERPAHSAAARSAAAPRLFRLGGGGRHRMHREGV